MLVTMRYGLVLYAFVVKLHTAYFPIVYMWTLIAALFAAVCVIISIPGDEWVNTHIKGSLIRLYHNYSCLINGRFHRPAMSPIPSGPANRTNNNTAAVQIDSRRARSQDVLMDYTYTLAHPASAVCVPPTMSVNHTNIDMDTDGQLFTHAPHPNNSSSSLII